MRETAGDRAVRRGMVALAAARTLLGVVAVVRPLPALCVWVRSDGDRRPAIGVLGRALGGRDIGLGLGTLWALSRGAGAPAWLGAGAVADTVDLLASVASWRHLPTRARVLVVPASGAAAAAGLFGATRRPALRSASGRRTGPMHTHGGR
jgi:hypothetical protein